MLILLNFYPFRPTPTNFLTLYYFSSIKNGTLSSDMPQSQHFVGCHAIEISFSLISFLHVSRCLYLLHQAVRLTRIKFSGSSSSKLSSSRLALLRSIVWSSITKQCYIIRIRINKYYIIIRKNNIIKFFKSFVCNKPIRNKL